MSKKLKKYMDQFREHFEPALAAYLERKAVELGELDPSGQETARIIGRFASGGGKRIRAALVEIGYLAAGGRSGKRILMPAIGMELLHTYFLIHDDIMDRSDLRRGQPTVHKLFENNSRKLLRGATDRDREHFAESMAILAGDQCCAIAHEAITKSGFPSKKVIFALMEMHKMADMTIIGQDLDVITPLKKKVGEEDIIKIHELKTAGYTFDGPLHLGMILAGARAKELKMMSKYSKPVGIAFQIKDDLLGVFGSEEEVGKPVTSDLEEGKKTLLTVFVEEHGSRSQRRKIASLIGKHPISDDELNDAREIFRDVGAVAHSEELARELVNKGKEALGELNLRRDMATLLTELADLVISRTT